jgi:aryl-alcohol dehydrogenase-like predicted oxidoreductase
MMQSLARVVKSGKVLYLGISDTPAWIVSKANQYARDHVLTPFVVYQGCWNVMVRDFQRDILPMCIEEDMALAPWGAVGQVASRVKPSLRNAKRTMNLLAL